MTHNSQLDALFAKVVIKYYNMSISENIQRLRQERGIPQAKVAELIGMERTNYFRLEKRGNKLTIEQLEKIAGALGVSVIELITGEQQKSDNTEEIVRLQKRVQELEDDKEILQTNSRLKDNIAKSNMRNISLAVSAWKEIYEVIISVKPDETLVFDPYKLASLGTWLEVISSMLEDMESSYNKK